MVIDRLFFFRSCKDKDVKNEQEQTYFLKEIFTMSQYLSKSFNVLMTKKMRLNLIIVKTILKLCFSRF